MRRGLGVHQPHADVRVPPPGVRGRRALPEPGLHQAPVLPRGDLPDAGPGLGAARHLRHQEGGEESRECGFTFFFFLHVSAKSKLPMRLTFLLEFALLCSSFFNLVITSLSYDGSRFLEPVSLLFFHTHY